jgi:hypothetical protein
MGMEILWFRHFTILLGGFRAVFLLLTVILINTAQVRSLEGSYIGGSPEFALASRAARRNRRRRQRGG